MKILHVVPAYVPAWRYGGRTRSVHDLCRSLALLGHDVFVYTTNIDGDDLLNVITNEAVNVDNVQVTYFLMARLLRRLCYAPMMESELNKRIKSFDLVHLHSVFLWPIWVASRVASKFKIPYVVSPRGMLVKSLIRKKNFFAKSIWIKFIEQKTLENASAIHVTSKREGMDLEQFNFKLPSVHVIPNGVDVSKIQSDERSLDPKIKVLIDQKQFNLRIKRSE